jgi:hypothetical protein
MDKSEQTVVVAVVVIVVMMMMIMIMTRMMMIMLTVNTDVIQSMYIQIVSVHYCFSEHKT